MRIHYLENLATAGIGNIADWARSRQHTLHATRLHAGDALPDLARVDLLIVLGGVPQDCTAWIDTEIAFIREAVHAGKAVLGICLGSQLLAEALGGQLVPATHAESGWWPVRLRDGAQAHPLLQGVPESNTLFFFHRNTFTMPQGCVWLAQTSACAHQMYAYGDRVLGIQAHPEIQDEGIAYLAMHKADSLPVGPYTGLRPSDAGRADYLFRAKAMLFHVLSNMEAIMREAPTNAVRS
ncbi:type 1 glutamine amidotransferase [Burkholderia sp. GS2Y]|uniref:Type 1 glutamine amidotransferase n=1 Tax=Burkholderia theae TaxID=3143496 RepID=A0ABU9WRU8_9BURK